MLEVLNDGVRGIVGLSSGKNLAHFSRVEGKHRILPKGEALVNLTAGDLGNTAKETSAVEIRPVDARDEREVTVVVRHGTQG